MQGYFSSHFTNLVVWSLQSTPAKSFCQENGTAEVVGMVHRPHPDDLTAMEDCDWPIRPAGPRGAER